MSDANIVFDHVHLISEDPQSTASWYVEKLGGKMMNSFEADGVLHLAVAFTGARISIRNKKSDEAVGRKHGREWGTDHFGFQVNGDFYGFCDDLRKKGVTFEIEPMDFGPNASLAFIEAPDGVSIELIQRRE